MLLRSIEIRILQSLTAQSRNNDSTINETLMIRRYDKRSLLRNIILANNPQSVVQFQEHLTRLGVKRIEERGSRQFERRVIGKKHVVPINLTNVNMSLALFNLLSNRPQSCHHLRLNINTKGLLNESLQSYLIKRVKGKICLKMIISMNNHILL